MKYALMVVLGLVLGYGVATAEYTTNIKRIENHAGEYGYLSGWYDAFVPSTVPNPNETMQTLCHALVVVDNKPTIRHFNQQLIEKNISDLRMACRGLFDQGEEK